MSQTAVQLARETFDPSIARGPQPRTVAVLVPCYNEGGAIAQVVSAFRAELPDAMIFVYDNNSTDGTKAVAAEAGAIVRSEDLQGKGHVVRRMFSDIDADVYVMVDGDATYDAAAAPKMIELLWTERLDMVVGRREHTDTAAYRPGHVLGNSLLTGCVTMLFGQRFTDILSGYRVFSRRFVKSFPALATGFETETELTVHALQLGLPIAEVSTRYAARPEGTASKLRTYRDGARILAMIVRLFRTERPLAFFGLLSGVSALASVLLAIPVVLTFFETGLVPRLPTAVLSMGLMLLGVILFGCGLILDTVTQGRKEAKRLAYLLVAPRSGHRSPS